MDSKNQQIEFEVFPKSKKSHHSYPVQAQDDTSYETGAAINIAFSHQSVIIICICVVMLLVGSFTLGVEKGKLIAKNELSGQRPLGEIAAIIPEMIQETGIADEEETFIEAIREDQEKTPASQAVQESEEKKSVPKSGYTIQVASLKTEESAKSLKESLAKQGLPSFTKASGEYIVILAGNFTERKNAETALKELQKRFKDCFIKKI